MEERINSFPSPDASRGRVQPIMLISRLMQQTANMRHVDEVFLWLAQAMVQSLDIAVVQFLAIQQDGQFRAEVRAIASQNPSPSQTSYVNNQVTALAEHISREQIGSISRPVENIFPPLPAALLAQHDLRCWTGYFLRNEAFLPPAAGSPVQAPMPFTMLVSLFTLSPLSGDQMRAITFILEQSARIIASKGFLILHAPTATQTNPFANSPQAYAPIIPRRAESIEQFQVDNPFANASTIMDRNARRLYTAIDGNKNVAELIHMMGFEPKETLDAFRYLFEQQKIRFYTLKGDLVQNPDFISPPS